MAFATESVLRTRNPATGAEVGRVAITPPEHVAKTVDRARAAQEAWAATSWQDRRSVLARVWGRISRDREAWSALIRDEIGKPRNEALAGDVIPTLDGLRWTVKQGGRALRSETIGPGWQRWLLLPSARLEHCPVGVVGVIGTWNYPLFLNSLPIAQALAAGNAVVWKPSELAVAAGVKLQETFEAAGFPPGLVAAVHGGGETGEALVNAGIDKGVFTGGIANGRRVLTALSTRGIPAIAELSGFDPAIILPDSPLECTVRAVTWASFVGCGQTCVAVKRVYIVGDPKPWLDAFSANARRLRIGDPARDDVDLGPMINPTARDHFHETIERTVRAGAKILHGGRPFGEGGSFYEPTVLFAETDEPEAVLAGVFGPVMLIRAVATADEAIAAANGSPFALGASVWGKNRNEARMVARRVQAGMVCINDAVTPTAHAAAPFGGRKASGYGRTHGVLGIREFTQPRALFDARSGGFRPQLYPYGRSAMIEKFLDFYCRLFHRA